MAEIKFSNHPEYERKKDLWQLYKDLHDGDHATLTGGKYLWFHELELSKAEGASTLRKIREERSRYTNFAKQIVKRFQALFFQNSPSVPQEVLDLFGDDYDNVDGNGKSFEQFVKEDALFSRLLYGKLYWLTDSFALEATNKIEEQDLGLRPFWSILPVLEVRDWQRETSQAQNYGDLRQLRCEYTMIENRESLLQEPIENRYSKVFTFDNGVYRALIFRGEKGENGGDMTWLPSGEFEEVGLAEMPIATMPVQDSWLKEAAQEILVYHNLKSSYLNLLNTQAFQRIFIAGEGISQDRPALSEYAVTFINSSDANIQVIEPANTAALETALDGSASTITKLAFNQTRFIRDNSAAVESADTLDKQKEDLIAMIKSEITALENVTNTAIAHWAMFKGVEAPTEQVSFDKDITIESLQEQIALFGAFADQINKHDTWRKSVNKKAAERMNLPDIDAIKEEIDSKPAATAINPDAIRESLTARLTRNA